MQIRSIGPSTYFYYRSKCYWRCLTDRLPGTLSPDRKANLLSLGLPQKELDDIADFLAERWAKIKAEEALATWESFPDTLLSLRISAHRRPVPPARAAEICSSMLVCVDRLRTAYPEIVAPTCSHSLPSAQNGKGFTVPTETGNAESFQIINVAGRYGHSSSNGKAVTVSNYPTTWQAPLEGRRLAGGQAASVARAGGGPGRGAARRQIPTRKKEGFRKAAARLGRCWVRVLIWARGHLVAALGLRKLMK